MHKEVKEDFNTKYSTWIIGFCPDTNSFFVTNERHFYYQYDKEFSTEEEGISFFKYNIAEFKKIHDAINIQCSDHLPDFINLENTEETWY